MKPNKKFELTVRDIEVIESANELKKFAMGIDPIFDVHDIY